MGEIGCKLVIQVFFVLSDMKVEGWGYGSRYQGVFKNSYWVFGKVYFFKEI